jgi:hypothetical protein
MLSSEFTATANAPDCLVSPGQIFGHSLPLFILTLKYSSWEKPIEELLNESRCF